MEGGANPVRYVADIRGNDTVRLAAAGDLLAQRLLVASALAPSSASDTVKAGSVAVAESWARMAAAQGHPEDTLRLVHVLSLKEELVAGGLVAGSRQSLQAEQLALLAVAAEGDDPAEVRTAINALLIGVAHEQLEPGAAAEAREMLSRGGHALSLFDALTESPALPTIVRESDPDRRSLCFEALAAAVSNDHQVDRPTAHALISTTRDYDPSMLDSHAGWQSIRADIALRLSDVPAVTEILH